MKRLLFAAMLLVGLMMLASCGGGGGGSTPQDGIDTETSSDIKSSYDVLEPDERSAFGTLLKNTDDPNVQNVVDSVVEGRDGGLTRAEIYSAYTESRTKPTDPTKAALYEDIVTDMTALKTSNSNLFGELSTLIEDMDDEEMAAVIVVFKEAKATGYGVFATLMESELDTLVAAYEIGGGSSSTVAAVYTVDGVSYDTPTEAIEDALGNMNYSEEEIYAILTSSTSDSEVQAALNAVTASLESGLTSEQVAAALASATGASGVVVDPYIEGAVFCVDENTNNTCDTNEPVSTTSTSTGAFSFASTPADNAVILMKTAGTHNGVPYSYDKLKGIYEGGSFVVSPVSTLYAKGITAAQLAEMFTYAGLNDVNESNMLTNPMNGLYSGSSVNAENLAVLRSSLASYMFLRIIEGSTTLAALTGSEIYSSAMNESDVVHTILSNMATVFNSALDSSLLTTLQTNMSAVTAFGFPEITFDDVVATAVAIADKLAEIGYTTCNATSGDDSLKVSTAVTAVMEYFNTTTNLTDMVNKLGPAFYLARVKSSLSSAQVLGASNADATFATYLSCESGSFVLDDVGNISCYSE